MKTGLLEHWVDFCLPAQNWLSAAPIASVRTLLSWLLLMVCAALPTHAAALNDMQSAPPTRLALIVGVAEVPGLPHLKPLQGIANDVKAMRALAGRLGVVPENMSVLSDTGDATSPTYAAILDALRQIEARSVPGTQVLAYFAGHGGQQPAVHSENHAVPEFDGLDEIYFAADAGPWDDKRGSAPNVLTDNWLRSWLERLEQKGVSVWLIVDMCHAGTFSRGDAAQSPEAGYDIVAWRGATLADIGIDLSTPRWRQFTARGRAVLSVFTGRSNRSDALEYRDGTLANVSAFYATDERGLAPEVRSRRGGGVHGLLTLMLTEETNHLLDKNTPAAVLSYRLLMQRILARYRRDMPGIGGPAFEGVDEGKWYGKETSGLRHEGSR